MSLSILVRSGFGKEIPNIRLLSEEEIDRLTSRTLGPEENLAIEFEIEKEIRKYGEALGIIFCEDEKDATENNYGFKDKGLSWQDENAAIQTLNLPVPRTTQLSGIETPLFPFILKNPESRRGREVYFIENNEMLEKVKLFLKNTEVSLPNTKELFAYDPSFESQKFICQEYIATPSERFTTYRVLVSCTGKILASRLTYSGNSKSDTEILTTTNGIRYKRDVFTFKDSPLYLGSKKIVSNQSAGGGGIVLNPGVSSKSAPLEEKELLSAHKLNPDFPQLPKYLEDTSIEIASYFGEKAKGLIFGIDWIQSKEGDFYYLETNPSPASKPYIDTHLSGKGTHQEAMVSMLKTILSEL